MSDLWERVARLRGRTLYTVRGHPFEVHSVAPTALSIIVGSSGLARNIRRIEIELAYATRLSGGHLTPARVRLSGASEFNSAYVAAIVEGLP